jgi:hypothetical protein
VSTNASPGGGTSIQQHASLETVCDSKRRVTLDRAVSVANHHLGDLALARPPKFTETIHGSADWVTSVQIRLGEEEIRRDDEGVRTERHSSTTMIKSRTSASTRQPSPR